MTVTFCGHRDSYCDEILKQTLYSVIEELIVSGANKFFLGGYGNFDTLAAETVYKLKESYPFIESVLIIPYLDRNYTTALYDYTLYPPIEAVPKRFAVLKRNVWMVENSDVLISYIRRGLGGAAKTVSFAEKRGKRIIYL